MSKVEISSESREGVLRLSVRGELDMESSPELLGAVRDGLRGVSGIELDLKDVGYVDSSGIAVLVHGYKLAHKNSVRYEIVDPSPKVMAVIELSQLQKFFVIRHSGNG